MNKILGLDLGTNSIGWAIVEKEKSEKEYSLIDKGVRIFSEGVNIEAKTSSESSKAAQRTDYRSGRKLKYRRKLRKLRLLKVLSDNNLCPTLSDEELNLWRYKKIYPENDGFRLWLSTDNQDNETERKKQNKNPYAFRYKVSTQKLDLNTTVEKHELGRALYHMAQRRGFLSNRLDTSDNSIIEEKNSEIEDIIQQCNTSEELLKIYNEFLEVYDKSDAYSKALFTLGRAFKTILKENVNAEFVAIKEKLLERLNRKEFLGKVKSAISDLSAKIEEANCNTLGEYFYGLHKEGLRIRNNYTHREEHYLHEFHVICDQQNLSTILKKEIENAIFFQRPLKSQKGLVAKCPLENDKACVPISHPDFELFRMYGFINSIKTKPIDEDKLRFLNTEEKLIIAPLFYRKSKPNFDFEEISKKLTPKNLKSGYYKDKNTKDFDILFNFGSYTNVSGCPTIANLRSVFGEDWKTYLIQNFKKKNKDNSNKTEDQIIDAIWHILFRFDKTEKLKQFVIDYLGCDEVTAIKFSKIKLKQDYGSLSLKAIRNILPYLEKGLLYSHAVFLANMKTVLPKEAWNNETDRHVINKEVFSIIDNFNTYKNRVDIVNGLIKKVKDNKETWSDNNTFVIEAYKKDIVRNIQDYFGLKRWDSFSEEKQKKLLKDSFSVFSSQMKLNSGRGEFLKRETLDERVKDFLRDNFNIEEDKLKKLYHPSAIEVYNKAKRSDKDEKLYLGSPLISSIKNPMAMRALHQLRKVINQLIKDDAIDENTIVRIEMARELKSANERVAIRQWQNDLQNNRKEYVGAIRKLYKEDCGLDIEPSQDEILKYQLWLEQNRVCLYTGKSIGICDFIGANPKFDIEHTVPRSKSLDNSQTNKTLCCSIYNRDIKKDKIPTECSNHEEILPLIKHWYAKYKNLETQIRDITKKVRVASTKEGRDSYIQKRAKLRFEYNYLKHKYRTFTITEIPKGFKNSQSVDIGIISKYGNLFLKSLFIKVYPVKGKTTSNLRDIWGLDKKERVNHAHHAKDAVVVACCSKDINDALAEYYHNYEDYKFYGKPKPSFKHRIPWKGFNNDVKSFDVNTLISHHTPNVLPIQSKKAIRKQGIIQRNEKGEIKYKQGDTVRGALHKESFYGAIKREETNKKGEVEDVIKYVLRKPLESFSDTDLKNIVDDTIKAIVINGRSQENILKKEIETFKKQINKVNDAEEQIIKAQIEILSNKIKNELYVLPNKNGKPVPIKKIRYFTTDVKAPLEIKKHRDISRHEHKQHYFAKNDSNYCMAIYEGVDVKGKVKRSNLLINNLDAGSYFKKSNTDNEIYPIAPEKDENNNPLKYILTKGKMVLVYDKTPNELFDMEGSQLLERLFQITQMDVEASCIKLLHHSEAREKKSLTSFMGLKSGMKGGKNIGEHKKFPWIKVGVNSFDCLVEGYDFRISASGKLEFVN
ncbi:type II CRISPR RNA-guided endonuclease Cas9 [Lacinutrix sp. Bg11-31]|uniref:type II CRISPR RNA-guided endonuclease Cas9 n=1 Tax=Lacinutrix sp. Bg11-31 TaxID=2057808 RepID=UPI000C307CBC|nr:type II CRISPR RNA-guided endonuclease Cas9 [Lacinutrix sp. Bg11-31]AUC82211.1 type II CRISPR RNA-guided endonuclease Cas9 [Lacinutrix sp. Bg11-31]